jgi:hypothetical protein
VPCTDTAEPPPFGRLDRRRDLAGWLLTPVITLVVAPAIAGLIGMTALLEGSRPVSLCEAAVAAGNRCGETIVGLLGQPLAVFTAAWLALWMMPWWRGLRTLRIGWAAVAAGVLLVGAIRMAASKGF